MKEDNINKKELGGNFNNVFDRSSLSQNNMITFNKDNAQTFLEKVRESIEKDKIKFNFEDMLNGKTTNYEFKLTYAKEVLQSLVRKKLIRKEDFEALDFNK